MRKLLVVLLLVGTALGQTKTTVTGVVQDASGNLATSGTVVFNLSPQNSGIIYFVTGTGIIAPQTGTCGIDGSGNIKNLALSGACQVWGTDLIQPANLTYQVAFFPNGVGSPTNTVAQQCITGTTYDLSNPKFCPVIKPTPQGATVITSPIQNNLIPSADAVFNLGSASLRYGNIFASTATFTNNIVAPNIPTGTVNTGAGTTNTIPKYTNGATGVLGNSSVTDDGTTVSTSENLTTNGIMTATSMNTSSYLFVDRLVGADFCVKGNACEAALLITGGGICDSRALRANQACSVTWAPSTNQVRHLLGDMTLLCGTLNPCINWSANAATLEGASWNNTVFSTASGTADILKVTSVGSQSHFSNFKTTSSVVRTAGDAIHIQGGNNTWDRIWMEPTFNGIVLDTAGTGGNNFFDRVEIQGGGSGAAWNCGVLVGGVATNNVASNQFHHLAFLSNGPAFSDAQFCIQDGADSTTIESSMFVANVGGADAVGLHIERVNGGNPPSNTKISDLTIEGGITKNGIVIDSANGVDFTGGTIQTSLKGLVVNAGTRIAWNGGLLYNNKNEGISVTALDALGTFEVTGTRFANNGNAANNTWDDILIAAGVGNFVINSNTFGPAVATAVLPRNNIKVTAGASDNYSIVGNIFPGTTFATAKISDGGTGINKILCNSSDANVTVSGCQGLIINSAGLPQFSIQGSKGPYFSAIREANGSASSVVWTSTAVDPNNAAPDTGISVPSAGVLAFGNGAITPGDVSGTIEGAHLGATAKPWTDLFVGTAATNNFKFQPAATAGARIITITDPVSPTTVGLPLTIASGTAVMPVTAFGAAGCNTAVTVAATGALTTDSIIWAFNADPGATTGYSTGALHIYPYVTAGNVNFRQCSSGALTPGAATLNWRVVR